MQPKASTQTESGRPLSSALRFRILKRPGWKASFRLEEAFWDVLSDAARSQNMKTADYVRATVEQLDEGARNLSSALRVRAVEFLLERCRSLEKPSELQNMIRVALTAPAPCFVLSSARQLINHNREFHEFVISAGARMAPGGASSALLTLDVAVPKLIDLLSSKPEGTLICGYSIKMDARLLRGRARVALAMEGDTAALVGYILDSNINLRPASAS
jgi:predicted DNA-binding ribbon-helix-helix protein